MTHVDLKSSGEQTATWADAHGTSLWRQKLAGYRALAKGRQTLLLLATGVCSYLLSSAGDSGSGHLIAFVFSLLFSVSGCTALNMVVDRDIDMGMVRTRARPLVSGILSVAEAMTFGLVLSVAGLALAFGLSWKVGTIITAGFVFDLGIYSLWLKRRSPLSIIFGGVSGGMPALAGRVLATGSVDVVGLLFVLSIVLWIPSHIVTLSIKYRDDYAAVGVPVWPNVYGDRAARRFVALANVGNVGALLAAGFLLQIAPAAMICLAASGIAMVSLALHSLVRPSERSTWVLFKAASVYMLLSFLLITLGTVF
jgi:heme o synthase